MTTASDIDEQKLLHLLTSARVDNSCEGHKDFHEWRNETEVLRASLTKIGQISIQPADSQYELQYWGEDAPIQLDKYPYYGCEVFQCAKCSMIFFYYLELGGHGAQKRYRVVRKELIDLERGKPNH